MNDILFLIDEDLKNDKRVLLNYNQFTYKDIRLLKCKKDYKKKCLMSYFMLKNLLKNLHNFNKYRKKYKISFNSYFSGFNRSFKNWCLSESLAKKLSKQNNNYQLLFANDLMCGIVGGILKTNNNFFIYDSHEVQFHRNRKNSFFRSLFDYSIEREIVKKADEIRVVNIPIKNLYEDIYNIDSSKIKVINNNHFECYYGYYKRNINYGDIGVLYIGAGIKGRMLENLAVEAKHSNVDVFAFFLKDIPKFAYDYNWHIGEKDYIEEVKMLIKQKTLLMWCVNDISSLSYKLALPNKFFQAVALGIPVIAYQGTYLSEIVKKYNIGYIYNDNLSDIVDVVKKKTHFLKIVENMNIFQKLIYEENLIL